MLVIRPRGSAGKGAVFDKARFVEQQRNPFPGREAVCGMDLFDNSGTGIVTGARPCRLDLLDQLIIHIRSKAVPSSS